MTRRRKLSFKQRVSKYLTWWADFLGLSQTWEIAVHVAKLHDKAAGGHPAGARIEVQFPYRRAEVFIDTSYSKFSGYDLEYMLLHELLHVFIMPLEVTLKEHSGAPTPERFVDQMEDLCDMVTRCLLRLKYPKRSAIEVVK